MPKLTVTEGPSRGKTFDLDEDVLFLGRSSKCDVQILDPNVSRIHAKIFKIVSAFFIEDLKSSNGTFVNGEFLKPGDGCQVGPEDIILLGKDTRISLEEIPAGKAFFQSQKPIPGLDTFPQHPRRDLVGERRSRSLGQLNLISSVSRFLTDPVEFEEFIRKMLKAVIEVLPRVDRAAVFLCKAEKENAEFFAGQAKSDRDGRTVDYDKAIVRRVLREKKPVFLADTSDKQGSFSGKETLRIKSVACFPIMAGSDTYGVLYLDGIRGPNAFREEDFSVLETLTNHIAAALINDQLASSILSNSRPEHSSYRSSSVHKGKKTNDATPTLDLFYRRKPAFISFLPTYLFCFVMSFLLVYFSSDLSRWINDQLFSLLRPTPDPLILRRMNYGMILAVPFVLFGMRRALWNSMSRYEVNTDGIHLLTGTLARKEYHLGFRDFEDVTFKQNIMEAPFKVGTLILKSGNLGEGRLKGFYNVKNLVDVIRLKKNEPPKKSRYQH